MSRPISTTSTESFSLASFVSGSYASITNQNNPVGENTSNTTYAQVNLTTGSGAETEAIWSFDCSSIPTGATINSVSCSCKCSINNQQSNRIATRQAQLYSGSTAMGSAYTVANSTTAFSITTGTWTQAQLQNARLRLYAKRGSNSTTSTYYFRLYGCVLTVNYTFSGTEYEVSFSNSSSDVTSDPSTTQYVIQAGSQEIAFYNIDDLNSVSITDNGNNVTLTPVYIISTSFNPSTIDSTNSQISTSATNTGNGCTDISSTTFATLCGGTQYFYYYNFSVTGIPSNATITDITVRMKVCRYSTYTWTAGICKGTTVVTSSDVTATTSSSSSPSSDEPQILTIESTNFSLSDLSNIKLKFTPTYNSSSSKLYFYGADLIVRYTVPGQDVVYYSYTISNIASDHIIVISDAQSTSCYIKVNGSWVKFSKIYKKVSGVWTEVTDATGLLDNSKIYIRQ